jgi:hypothetical protein
VLASLDAFRNFERLDPLALHRKNIKLSSYERRTQSFLVKIVLLFEITLKKHPQEKLHTSVGFISNKILRPNIEQRSYISKMPGRKLLNVLLAEEVLNYQNIYVYYSIMVGQSFTAVILLVHTLVKCLVHVTKLKLNDLLFFRQK